MHRGLRITINSGAALEGIARKLDPQGEGEVSMVLLLADRATEVELRLPGRFKVSPQVCGALKAVPGVLDAKPI